MRKTKIVCTLGPATDRGDVLRQLFLEGMNVGRLNFSHGTHDEHLKRIERFKSLRKELDLPAGLMLDMRGPEIRIRQFAKGEIALVQGASFTFTVEDVIGNESLVSVTYQGFPDSVEKGTTVLLDDGLIAMKVTGRTKAEVFCEVINGGVLSNNKKINIPGAASHLPFFSDKDRADMLFGIEHDFEFIAASFVRNSNDINELKEALERQDGGSIKIISKIELREGVDNIDDIIRVSDGIMIARGDMGVEIPFEELPSIQKSIIKKCRLAGKQVITATQMLDSMIRNPRPTRAEITDVANAIYDGTSAIMLSGETSVGMYPVESVMTMSKIALETEKDIDIVKNFHYADLAGAGNVTDAISHATCETARTLGAKAIISVTKSGHTANMVSKYHPASLIIGATSYEKIYNQLSLSWGVYPMLTELKHTTDEMFSHAVSRACDENLIKNGDIVVITGGTVVDVSGTTNLLKVHIVVHELSGGRGK
jgi:pyruvate kinase